MAIWEPPPPIVGQLDSKVLPGQTFAVRLPTSLIPQIDTLSGRYFLLRCNSPFDIDRGSDWSVLLRRPIFVCGRQAVDKEERWLFCLPLDRNDRGRFAESNAAKSQYASDAGFTWLAKRAFGDPLNLLGPFGNGFSLLPEMQNLLILVDVGDDSAWFWKMLPLCEQALDGGGKVTVLIKASSEESVASLVPFLPIQVEVRASLTKSQWLEQVSNTMAWADQVCAGVPFETYGELLAIIREARFRTDRNFAQVLVNTDLLCGVGACLVCAVPTARGGLTRACVHGPVFDLMELAE